MKIQKNISKIFLTFLFAGMLFFPCSCASTGAAHNSSFSGHQITAEDRVKGEYLIKLLDSAGKADIERCFSKYEIVLIKSIKGPLYKLKINNDPGIETLKNIADICGKFEYIEPNYIYKVYPPKKKKKLQRVKEH